MNQLLKIEDRNGQSVVSARELHAFLGLSERLSKWMDRMMDYGFVEGVDYTPYHTVHPQNNQEIIDYALTIETAKELSMIQRTDKGKQARLYFLECERRLNNPVANLSRLDIAKMLLEAETEKVKLIEENQQKDLRINEMRPKEIFADSTTASKDTILMKELAGYLNQKGINTGQNRLFDWMRQNGFLCTKGNYYNLPTQKALDLKLFEVEKTTINKPNGDTIVNTTTKVTGKGQVYFVNKFLN